MKPKYIIVAAIVAAFVGFIVFSPEGSKNISGSASSGRKPIPAEGSPVPALALKDLSGAQFNIESEKGNVVIVNFWATWCPPCKAELPSLNNLYAQMLDRKDLKIVTIPYNDSPENGLKYFKDNGFNLPILVDAGGQAAYRYGLTGVPETFFIDRKGVLRKWIKGPIHFDSQDAINYINTLLAEQS